MDTKLESARIYPLVVDSSNERVLRNWIEDHDTYRAVDTDRPLTRTDFDLCIVDEAAIRKYREELETVKSEAAPVILPILLLLPETRAEVIETDSGDLADNVFPATVDEIVSTPIRQAELEWRIKALLRLRGQSLESYNRSSELRLFRQAIEDSGHAVMITETDGTIRYVNSAFTELTGYEPRDAIGKNPRILNSGEMPDGHFDRLWETILSGEIWEEEIVNRRKSGEQYYAHQTIAPVFDDDGEIEAFVAIQIDVSERKEIERARKRYEEIVERLGDPIMLQDRDGNFELLNDAVTEFAGRSRDTLLGSDEFLFMDEEAAERIDRKKREVLDAGEPVEYEIEPEFEGTGKEATFSTRRYPYYDGNGTLAGTLAICRDVTQLKRREDELRQYERAIVGATDLIAATDRHERYLFANPQYREYHGIETDDVTDLTLEDVLGPEEYAEVEKQVDRARQGETVRYRMTRTHPEQGERVLTVHYYPLEDEGEITGIVAVLRDVTDREDQTRQLHVVDRVLRHNLRNDLNVVRLQAEQISHRAEEMADTLPAEDVPECLETLEEFEGTADGIVETVDELLTTSGKSRKITQLLSEQQKLTTIDVGRVSRMVTTSLADEYPDARIDVESPDSAVALATEQFDEAVAELITNAIVHNDSNSPTVQLHVAVAGDEVRLRIVDDGPGIPEMDREILTEGREIDALYHGSGLGLWLVYWIVCRASGSIEVSDIEPRGTEITITLPRYEPRED